MPQSLLRGRFLRRAGSCRPLFRCRAELLRLDECRIDFLSDISLIFQYTGDHVFVPCPPLIVGDLLSAECLGQLPQRGSRAVTLEDKPHQLCLLRLDRDLAQRHTVAEGLLSVSHYRTVLSMDSRSSSPLCRRKRRVSLLSTMISATSAPHSSVSGRSRKSGPSSSRAISSCVRWAVASPSAAISFSLSSLACRSWRVSSLLLDIKMSGSTRPFCLRKASVRF